ncbi:sensor histidine kinase [Marinomonas sp. FW-1]|uniref:sensor histidine kinase n=1 Tax=Marinomonas sp. FW-1 TaxID=2071621 RepID=UPI0010C103B5|nr:HAMP domain-containing sensor histidine kinase [Marinomonas sp. FW-1]
MQAKAILSQKKPLLAVYLIGILLIITLLSFGAYRYFLDSKVNQLAWTESEILSRSASVISREMGHIKRVTMLLRNSVTARLTPQWTTQSQNAPFPDDWKAQVAEEFAYFAQTSELISQVRWISVEGRELIRINAQAGVISRVSEEQLQNKSHRNYVKNAPKEANQEVYITPLDLNIENQEIVRPFQPTVRGAIRMADEMPGILVVNYDLTQLFELMRSLSRDDVALEVLDDDGYWVLASDKRLEWGGILHPNDARFNIKSHFPAIWQEMNTIQGLERLFSNNRLWSMLELPIDGNINDRQGLSNSSSLYLVALSDAAALVTWQRTLMLSIIGVASLCFLLTAWLVWRKVSAQFEAYRLLQLIKQERDQVEQTNQSLNLANQKLIDLQDELVETSKLSSLGLMVAGLAHEMHTPLGGVRMALSSCKVWLDKEANTLASKTNEGMVNSLAIAEKNLSRAINVVASFKRIVSDRTAQEVQTFYLHDVVNDIVFTYKPTFKKRSGIILKVEVAENIQMLGYPGILSQILQNLIDNALEHGFQRLDTGEIKLVAFSKNDHLELKLSDNGRGIAPEMQKRIFEPFATTGRSKKHTGLGLHLVSQWVNKLMQGRIEVVSEVGVGTTFRLTIPLEQKIEEES